MLDPKPRAELGDSTKAIWALAWPVTLAMLSESLVGLADMIMVGRLGSGAVAAVGVGGQILSASMVVMAAVSTGTMALVARRVGSGATREAQSIQGQAVTLSAMISLSVILPVISWARPLVGLFGIDTEVAGLAVDYTRLAVLAALPGAILFVVESAQGAAGDTRTPLWINLGVNLLNVFLNWVLIFGNLGAPALGVKGSALATVLAFTAGTLVALGLAFSRRLRVSLEPVDLRLRWDSVRRVLDIGYPAALEQSLMQLGFILYLVFAARYGTDAVAAYFIGVRILGLSFLPGFGFAAAASALVGQNLGAREPGRAARVGWLSTGMAVASMSVLGFLIVVFAQPIAEVFVDDPAVVSNTVWFIYMLGVSQPCMAIDFSLGGALRGAGDTRFPLLVVVVSFYGVRLALSVLVTFVWQLSLPWLWAALIGDYVVRAALKAWRFRQGRWALIEV
ncbi:MATE family efflux transporter [Myxococcota bacterium]|nr:MATE family efflux transporter [Myxococcota bacterium]